LSASLCACMLMCACFCVCVKQLPDASQAAASVPHSHRHGAAASSRPARTMHHGLPRPLSRQGCGAQGVIAGAGHNSGVGKAGSTDGAGAHQGGRPWPSAGACRCRGIGHRPHETGCTRTEKQGAGDWGCEDGGGKVWVNGGWGAAHETARHSGKCTAGDAQGAHRRWHIARGTSQGAHRSTLGANPGVSSPQNMQHSVVRCSTTMDGTPPRRTFLENRLGPWAWQRLGDLGRHQGDGGEAGIVKLRVPRFPEGAHFPDISPVVARSAAQSTANTTQHSTAKHSSARLAVKHDAAHPLGWYPVAGAGLPHGRQRTGPSIPVASMRERLRDGTQRRVSESSEQRAASKGGVAGKWTRRRRCACGTIRCPPSTKTVRTEGCTAAAWPTHARHVPHRWLSGQLQRLWRQHGPAGVVVHGTSALQR
jgi:hypothetical protein